MSAASLDASPAGAPPDLAWLRRGWWVVVVSMVLGAVGGLLLASVQTKTYESKTTVLVTPTSGSDGTNTPRINDVNMDNEIQIVRSQPVAEEARSLLRVATPTEELIKAVTVVVPANTLVLQIGAESDTAEGALTLSHAFAESYLKVRGDGVEAAVDAERKALEENIKALTDDLKLYGNKDDPNDAAQRQILVNGISQANQRLAALRLAQVEPGRIINDARLPDGPSSPVRLLYLASGAVVGLLIGLALAYVLGGRRRRVRSASDVGDGRVSAFELPGPISEVAMLPVGRGGDVFDRLRLALTTAVPAERPAVLVCPATRSRGASLITVNLASALARSGHRVLVLCADSQSDTPSVLGVRADAGLADCLRDSLELSERVQVSSFSQHVAVVAPGRDLDQVLAATSAERLAVLLLKLRQDTTLVRPGDFVLVEAPDTTQGVDAQELARVVDCCVVVAENGRATVRDVERTESDLRGVGASVAAHVVVPSLPERSVARDLRPLDDRLSSGSGHPAAPKKATPSVPAGTDPSRG